MLVLGKPHHKEIIMENILIKVGYDDTIEKIATRYNITPAIIKSANLNIQDVEEGDMLIIPYRARAIHTVRPLETLREIAEKYATTPEIIKANNNLTAPLFVGQQLIIV